MRFHALTLSLLAFALAAACASVSAEPRAGGSGERASLSLERVASGFRAPVYVTAPRSEPGRLYVVEQPGRILVLENGRVRSAPFLDIRSLVEYGSEQGLLGLAFHPSYERNRRFYVNYTDNDGDTRVVEYRSNGQRALPATARRLLFVDQPYPNHNGGHLAFGPEGRLYVGMGDGGSGGDPENRAQNIRSRLGKLLSINAATGGVRMDALGLRNPWRFSFDRANGDLYIGDVGQGMWEEIDYVPRRNPGLENYGWDVWEGRMRFERKRPSRGRVVFPVTVYGRAGGNCTVIGGYVYRGRAVPAARGRYFYGDFCSGVISSLTVRSGRARGVRRERFRVNDLSSFGEDVRGELYLVSLGGTIYRLAR